VSATATLVAVLSSNESAGGEIEHANTVIRTSESRKIFFMAILAI